MGVCPGEDVPVVVESRDWGTCCQAQQGEGGR